LKDLPKIALLQQQHSGVANREHDVSKEIFIRWNDVEAGKVGALRPCAWPLVRTVEVPRIRIMSWPQATEYNMIINKKKQGKIPGRLFPI
jgi:hypothetical protein